MSQNDFTIANQGFPAFRADLNSALQALATNSSGATAPSTTFANMWWYDSANNIMYIRNEDNDAWIKFAELDQTNDKFVLSGTLQLDDGSASAPALTFNSDTNMGIYRGGTDILKFVTAGTDAITIDASQQVGIGGSPSVPLHITDSNPRIRLEDSDASSHSEIQSNGQGDLVLKADPDNNGSSTQISFEVDGSERMRIDGTGLGIGTSSPSQPLEVSANNPAILLTDADNTISQTGLVGNISAEDSAGTKVWVVGRQFGSTAFVVGNKESSPTVFQNGGTEQMRLNGSGNLLVATTNTDPASGNVVGLSLKSNGQFNNTVDGGVVANINRKTDDGDIVRFRKDGTIVGSIGASSSDLYIGTGDAGFRFQDGSNSIVPFNTSTQAVSDNVLDLGGSSSRFDDIFATNGTIQTSDRNEKQDIEELSEAEQRVAVVAKDLMRKFRWIDSVAEKGDNARTHFGIIAQDLQDAFTAEGLDAGDYAMFTSNTWWELDGETYDTEEEAPEGATQRTRLGVRYNQLLAFIISAI